VVTVTDSMTKNRKHKILYMVFKSRSLHLLINNFMNLTLTDESP